MSLYELSRLCNAIGWTRIKFGPIMQVTILGLGLLGAILNAALYEFHLIRNLGEDEGIICQGY